MDGQASAPESGGLADLAAFIADTPGQESHDDEEVAQLGAEEEAQDDEEISDDTSSESNDEQDLDPENPDGEIEDEEPAPVEKVTFKVKGEDGKEETVEATTEEISKSWMRQQDYTKKTQALAAREDEAVKFLTQKHEEIRANYLQQAELTRAAVVQMAGIKSESEMAELAQSDPAGWVAENQRQRQISNYLNQLNQQIEGEKQQAEALKEQQQLQQRKQMFETTWQELSKDGIDKPKLEKLYGDIKSKYGITDSELATVYDHRMVRIMKDAAAYRALQEKKPVVMQKTQSAPRMPSRQQQPAQERIDKALNNKFKSGRAKLNDLAAYLR